MRYFILVLVIIFYLLTLAKTAIRNDDDYIGEQVYWLQKTGHVKSELMRGYNNIGIENYQSVFHKLFIYQGVCFSKLFGWSLQSLQLTSLFYAALFFFILFYYLKKRQLLYDKGTFSLMIVVMLSLSVFSEYSASFRPEIMVMTLGFISYIFLDYYLRENKWMWVVLSGIFAGAAFLTHLNGLIFIVAGSLLLVYKRKFPIAIVFGFVSSVVFLFYFIDIFVNSTFSHFIYQFRHDPSLSEDNFNWWTPFFKLFNEHMRFFNSPREIFFSILLIFSLFFVKKIKKHDNNLLIYTLILVSTLAFYTYSKTTKYLILYLPYLALIVAHGWQTIEETNANKTAKKFFRAILIIYIAYGIFDTSMRISKYIKKPYLVAKNAEVASWIASDHKNINILAPPSFIFNEIDSFNRIMSLMRFTFFIESHGKPPLNFSQVVDSAKKYEINYVILDKEFGDYFKIDKELVKEDLRYSLVKRHEDFVVLNIMP